MENVTQPNQQSQNFANTGITNELFSNQYDRQAVQGLGSMMSVFTGPATEYLQFFIGVGWYVLTWLSLPVEVVVRKDFGIRYMSIIRFAVSLIIVGLLRSLLSLIFGFGWLGWFWGWIVIMFFWWNWWNSRKKFKSGERWHSMSFGISRFQWLADLGHRYNIPFLNKMDDWFLYRFVEPGYFLVLGFFMRFLDPALGAFMLLAAVSLFIQNSMAYGRMWNRVLDIIDAEIEAGFYQQSIAGAPKTETAGLQVMRLPSMYKKQLNEISRDRPASSTDYASTVEETLGGVPAS